ncbi:MAG: serine--tRNA ligase [Planctomycetota bacterium]|jgi:seryl-tRNA synthetase|nr:serine--tRNA ligase [Planctomycetota bacterium]
MLDYRLLKDNPEYVREACRLKRVNVDADRAVELDARRRAILREKEALQGERNRVSKEIAVLKRDGKDTARARDEMKGVGARVGTLEAEERAVLAELERLMLAIPNHPEPDVPEGDDETANVVVAEWGDKPAFSFRPRPHWEIAGELGLLDLKRGVKISGQGFILYKGLGARLERALYNFFLDFHTSRHGYTEWFPPFLVNRASMVGTGQIPKLEEDMYHCDKGDDLFLIPTAEAPITNIHRDEILADADLNLKYCAYSACFRREAGAAGKDTRGLLRVHQFNKVELVKFTRAEDSRAEHEALRKDVEDVLRALNLHYRVVNLSTGDMSFAAAKCYDFEIWAAGVGKYLEASSCSNFTDFQARRANIRYRDRDKRTRFAHTLNASGVALPRTMVALMENNQREDGSVVVPEPLRPYMGGIEVIAKP